jgi:hypothetical protein
MRQTQHTTTKNTTKTPLREITSILTRNDIIILIQSDSIGKLQKSSLSGVNMLFDNFVCVILYHSILLTTSCFFLSLTLTLLSSVAFFLLRFCSWFLFSFLIPIYLFTPLVYYFIRSSHCPSLSLDHSPIYILLRKYLFLHLYLCLHLSPYRHFHFLPCLPCIHGGPCIPSIPFMAGRLRTPCVPCLIRPFLRFIQSVILLLL